MSPSELIQRIDKALDAAGISAAVEEDQGTIIVSGRVDSERSRIAAEDIIRGIAPDRELDNGLEVEDVLPSDVDSFQDEPGIAMNLPGAALELVSGEDQINPDFTSMTGSVMTTSDDENDDMDEPAFPPTDPVIAPSANNNAQILGGFSETSLDDVTAEPSALDGKPGDEALADAVRRELREDASTTALNVIVTVREGVAYLRGGVEGLEDIDNAESVAGRVPGILEVVEELEAETI